LTITTPTTSSTADDVTLHLSAVDVLELVNVDLAREAADVAARAAAGAYTTRAEMQVAGTSFRVLVGAIPSLDLLGYKQFHVADEVVRYVCHLFELSSGRPTAMVDGQHVTGYRTSASAAVAVAGIFAPGTPLRVAIVGSGLEARHGLAAVAAARTVASARVFSPSPSSREAFAREMSAELGIPVTAADTVAEAAEGCDLVYAGTDSRGRVVVELGDLPGVRMLVTVGSTIPAQRETAADVFGAASLLVVDTPDAFHASGDLIAAYDRPPAHLSLGELISGESALPEGLLIYKSIGSAEQDVVLASYLSQLAVERGYGTQVKAVSTGRLLSQGRAEK
jgi:alanine dehydrogenase